MTGGKRLRKLVQWIVPRAGAGPESQPASPERLIANAEHELSRLKRELDGVLSARTTSASPDARH